MRQSNLLVHNTLNRSRSGGKLPENNNSATDQALHSRTLLSQDHDTALDMVQSLWPLDCPVMMSSN